MIKTITTNLQVDTKIVRLLSKSTYQRSFSSAIRELVSNAYDADALSVRINLSRDYETIEILDDGNGMTYKEFTRYLTIAGTKSKNEYTRKYKRQRIGQFGIGFLSVFPFCEELEIVTTSENSTELLSTIIPAKEYMDTAREINVQDIPIEVKIGERNAESKAHYTRIRLIKPTYLVSNYFEPTETRKRDSTFTWDPFDRFKFELQEDLPIKYKSSREVEKQLEYKEPIGINVFLNGDQLYRNMLPETILESDTYEINDISFKYLFSSDYSSIKPLESRGIKLRINNVGIGSRTDFGLRRDRGFSRLHWIAGEVQIDSQAKGFLSINRDEFTSSPTIDQIIEYCADKLRDAAYFVETVSVAEKNIESTFKTSQRDKVVSKKDQIDSSLKALERKGFEIVEDFTIDAPITVDKKSKTVKLGRQHQTLENEPEKIKVLDEEFFVEYENNFDDSRIPCILEDRTIKINTRFPLFRSKTFGGVFRKFILMLLIESQNHEGGKQIYESITGKMLSEFEEYIN